MLINTLLWIVEDNEELPDRAEVLKVVRAQISLQQRSLKGFTVFTASVLRQKAMLAHLTSQPRKVASLLSAALKEAQRMAMRAEEAHIRFAIVRTRSAEPDEGARNLAAAESAFTTAGLAPALARLRAWQAQ
jgi:regulator of protease activity HflC (stomatin/prohibitin superfamily)